MRKRQMKWLWKRLHELAAMEISREEMLMKLGAARSRAPTAWRLVDIEMDKESSMFIYTLRASLPWLESQPCQNWGFRIAPGVRFMGLRLCGAGG
jgi:hypothetical protein